MDKLRFAGTVAKWAGYAVLDAAYLIVNVVFRLR